MLVNETNPERVKKLIENNDAVLLDFSATWCSPCAKLGKELEAVEKKHGNIVVVNINVENVNSKSFLKHVPDFEERERLKGVPILMFFKNGTRIREYLDKDKDGLGLFYGYVDRNQIENVLSKYEMI
jgi:thioredoxin 1